MNNPTGEMSIVDHLKELRRRVVISGIALLIGTIVGFIWYQHSVWGLPTLGDILRGPYCAIPAADRADFTGTGECRLLATAPFEMFLLRMKVGALVGIVLASPVWLYQIWGFITPGLLENERRWTFTFVTVAVTLFVAGAGLAYWIVDYGLSFLLTMGDSVQTAALTGERYFNFLLALLLIFGVSFEVPLIICMLNVIGLLEYAALRDKRRYIVVALFIFSAFMTPGQDPFSMIVLAFALSFLVELALQFCRINDKRKNRHRPDWLDAPDDAATPLAAAPQPIARPSAVAHPSTVSWDSPLKGGNGTDYSDVL